MTFDETFQKYLLERYDKRVKHFSQLLTATIVFAVAFLAFILVPLVGLQNDEIRIGDELKSNKAKQTAKLVAMKALALNQELATPMLSELAIIRTEQEQSLAELKNKNSDLEKQIDLAQSAINGDVQKLNILDKEREGFEEFLSSVQYLPELNVDDFVLKLQQFLVKAYRAISDGQNVEQLGINVDCDQGDHKIQFNCLVKAKVLKMLSVHDHAVRKLIVVPMKEIDPSVSNDFATKLDATFEAFQDILANKPGFWQEAPEKRNVGQQFGQELEDLSATIKTVIQNKIKRLDALRQENSKRREKLVAAKKILDENRERLQRASYNFQDDIIEISHWIAREQSTAARTERDISVLKTDIEKVQQGIDRLSEQQAKILMAKSAITKRIDNVESPFGTLPVGLTEALQIFPIIVAVGLIIAGLVLTELVELRRNYHDLLRRKYPREQDRVVYQISLIKPLFLDPCHSPSANFCRGSVLAIPALIYFAAIALISYSWSLDGKAVGAGQVVEIIYLAIYLAFAMGLFLPIIRLRREWRLYVSM